ncbi:MAG: domain S-box protein, partial [Frankiales bacterium]|nr:domain S-box protein [Frankiales bacterium]
MSMTRVVRDEAGPAVRALTVAVVAIGVLFSLTTVPGVRDGPTFWVPVDGWLQGTGYALMSLLAIARAVLVREHRFIWSVVAAAVTARSLGFLVYFSVVRGLVPQPYPSVSDAFWLLGTLLFLVSMAERSRRFSHGLSRLLVLDALMAGLTVSALAVITLRETVSTLTGPRVPERALVVNLVYPVLDVVALVLIAGLFAAGFRPRPSEALVIAGIGIYSVVEVVYLYELANGLFHPGTYLSALSYLGTLLPCLGAWARRTPFPTAVRTARPMLAPRPSLVVPAVLAVTCLLTLVVLPYTSASSPLPVVLLVTALLVVLVRGILTVQTDRGDAGAVIASRTEELMRFQALVETSNDFIAIAGLDGSVLYVNPAGRQMAGIPPDRDVTTTTIPDYLTDEGIAVSLAVEQPAVQRQGFWEGESTLRNGHGGPPIPVAINSFLMRDLETGEPFAMATVQRDITERRDAEEALNGLAEQRRELLARLVQAQEDERSRIAADVHDDSVQALAAVELR